MGKYWHVFGIGIQNTLVYRVNFFFKALFGLIPLLAVIQLWRSVYDSRSGGPEIAGYTIAEMISYYLVVTLVDVFTAVSDDDWQIAADIREGTISQFIVKPIDFLYYRLCLFWSGRLIYFAAACLPVTAFIVLQRNYFVLPENFTTLACFGASLVLTGLLQFFISFTMALLAFWVLEVSTFIFIVYAFEYLAGGHLFPLDILPSGLAEILKLTPFAYQVFFPVQVYLGRIQGAELAAGFAIQVCWVLFFYLVARMMWRRGLRKYGAYGG